MTDQKSKSKIIKLDQKTIDKIAAGEVVERPASVIKELVENSIDAKATKITILLEDYGLKLIQVLDNGEGMTKEEAAIAWQSHTTSKLRSADDLLAINSLGFRGEALASIAAVSRMDIITKTQRDQIGTHVRIKGGNLAFIKEKECTKGTSVSIHNLFYNVPARKKFLKTNTTELGHIIEAVTKQALIHPGIHFLLKHNQKELVNSPASDNPLDPIISLYGVDIAKKMIKVDYEDEDLYISGFTSLPELSRSSRAYEFLYVNSRAVHNQLLSEAIEEAYNTLLMRHRFPFAVLNLKIKSSAVDVNIHPTKREIKFANANEISDLVKKAISSALAEKELWRKNIGLIKEAENDQGIQTILSDTNGVLSIDSKNDHSIKKSSNKEQTPPGYLPIPDSKLSFKQLLSDKTPPIDKESITSLSSESMTVVFSDDFWLRPLGMALNLYVLCETNQGIAVVDIHATHERIRYEELTTIFEQSKIERQELLEPITVTLPPDKLAFIQDYLPELEKIGIVFEFFGGNTYLIRQLPVMMEVSKTEEDILNFIDEMHSELAKVEVVNDRIDLILKTMACHSAVRAGDLISLSKITAILRKLASCNMPYTCPHGRPTIIRIPIKALEKEFGRIV